MDLPNEHWSGWRIAGRHLVTPGRNRISVEILEHLVHMHQIRLHFERTGLQAQAHAAKQRRIQRAQQAVRVVVVDLGAWKARHGLGAA